ncbi:hypothetical protein M5689_013268 [Euphorbia peplus]|nr:hypothetical protein M5689_013268 [Euphorbia peplus]
MFKISFSIAKKVHHIEDLKLGSCILTILSFYAEKRELSQLLDSKSLTVIDPFLVETQPGISFLLTSCSVLEKLVIQLHGGESFRIWSFVEIEKDFWESDASAFDCPVSHLKTVEIVGLYYISTDDCGQGMVFAHDVCKKLECVQKASPSAIVEVECVSMVDVDSDSDWNKFVC